MFNGIRLHISQILIFCLFFSIIGCSATGSDSTRKNFPSAPELREFGDEEEEAANSEDPLGEEATDQEEPLSEEATDSEEPLSEEAANSEDPLSEEATDSEEPLSEEATGSEEPLSEEAADSEEPLNEGATDQEEPLSEEATDSEEPLSEEATNSEEPLIEEATDPEEPLIEEATGSEGNSNLSDFDNPSELDRKNTDLDPHLGTVTILEQQYSSQSSAEIEIDIEHNVTREEPPEPEETFYIYIPED